MAISVRRGAKKATGSSIKIYPAGAVIPKLPPGALVISNDGSTASTLVIGTKAGNKDYGKTDLTAKINEIDASLQTRAGVVDLEGLEAATANMLSGQTIFTSIAVDDGYITASTISAGTYLGLEGQAFTSLSAGTITAGSTLTAATISANIITTNTLSATDFYYVSTTGTDITSTSEALAIAGSVSITGDTISPFKDYSFRVLSPGLSTSATQPFVVMTGGNVGIGTTSADSTLHIVYSNNTGENTIANDFNPVGLQIENTHADGAAVVRLRSSDADGYILYDDTGTNAGDFFFKTDGQDNASVLTLKDDGKVGIRTETPSANLHIANTDGAATLWLTGPGSNPAAAANLRFSEQADGNNYIQLTYNGSSNILSFDSNDQADMLSIDRSGNEVFTGPGTKFMVGGSVALADLHVTTGSITATNISANGDFYINGTRLLASLESATGTLNTKDTALAAGTGSNASAISALESTTAGFVTDIAGNAALIDSLEAATGVLNTKDTALAAGTGSNKSAIDSLESATAHLASVTGTNQAEIASLEAATAGMVAGTVLFTTLSATTVTSSNIVVGTSADINNKIIVEGSSSNDTYDTFVGKRKYPRITLTDTYPAADRSFSIWNLGGELRFGTNAGSSKKAAFIVYDDDELAGAQVNGLLTVASGSISATNISANGDFYINDTRLLASLESACGTLSTSMVANAAGTAANQALIDSLESATGGMITDIEALQVEASSLQSATAHLASMTAANNTNIAAVMAGTGTNASAIASLNSATGHLASMTAANAAGTAANASAISSLESATGTLNTKDTALAAGTGTNASAISSLISATGHLASMTAANAAGTAALTQLVVDLKAGTAQNTTLISGLITSSDALAVGTGTNASAISSLESATGHLASMTAANAAGTAANASAISSLESATGVLNTKDTALAAGTGANASLIDSLESATGALNTKLAGMGGGTGANASLIDSLESATADMLDGSIQFSNIQVTNGSISADTISANTISATDFYYVSTTGTDITSTAEALAIAGSVSITGDTISPFKDYSLQVISPGLSTSATQPFVVMTGGNVGIGTTVANDQLNISNNSAPTFRLSRTDSGQIWQQSIDSNDRWQLKEAASEGGTKVLRLQIDDAGETQLAPKGGNVSIGNATPIAALHVVTGSVSATNITANGDFYINGTRLLASLESATGALNTKDTALAAGTGTNASLIDSLESATSHLASMTAANAAGTGTNASAISSLESATGVLNTKDTALAAGTGTNASAIGSLESATGALNTKDTALAAGTGANASLIDSLESATGALNTKDTALAAGTGANASLIDSLESATGVLSTSSIANAAGTGANASAIGSLESATGHLASMTAANAAGTAALVSAVNSLESATGELLTLANSVVVGTGTNASAISSLESATGVLNTKDTALAAGTGTNASAISSLESATGALNTKDTALAAGTGTNKSAIDSLESATADMFDGSSKASLMETTALSAGSLCAGFANSSTNQFYTQITSSGWVGIMTSNPQAALHIDYINPESSTDSIFIKCDKRDVGGDLGYDTDNRFVVYTDGRVDVKNTISAAAISALSISSDGVTFEELVTSAIANAAGTGTNASLIDSLESATAAINTTYANLTTALASGTGTNASAIGSLESATGAMNTTIGNQNTSIVANMNGTATNDARINGLENTTALINNVTSTGIVYADGHVSGTSGASTFAALSAHGDVVKMGEGTTTAGMLYYLKNTKEWALTRATGGSSGASALVGIAIGTSPTADGMFIRGTIAMNNSRCDNFDTNYGATFYLSPVSGHVDANSPTGSGEYVRALGNIIDADTTAGGQPTVLFNPSSTFIKVR